MQVSRSLTIKQMATVSGVAAVTIGIFIVIQLFHFVQQRRIDYAQQMENIAHTVRQPLSQAVLKADIAQAEHILNSLKPAGILARAEIVLPGGLKALHTNFEPEKPVPALVARVFNLPVTITMPLYSVEPANPKPMALLILQADAWRVYQFILSALSTMVTTYLLLALIMSIAISWCINKLIVRPLRRIANELHQLTPQEAATHRLALPNHHRDDELGMLIRSYNRNQQYVASKQLEAALWQMQPAIRELSQKRLTQEHDILQNIDRQHFALFLQPQVDMSNGKLMGAEALLRMKQADGSWLLPDDLIGNAEELGGMNTLGRWIFEESCRVLADWQARGIDLPLSVNLSAVQLHEQDMASHLHGLIKQYGIRPGNLILEITETAKVSDPELALRLLGELHDIGISVALDDFGMGYASLYWLSQFKSLPVSKVKVDRCFVRVLPDDDTMVRIVVAIAGIIKLDVIAEGVETPEQRDWLLARGIRVGQGFLYASALPIDEFNETFFASG